MRHTRGRIFLGSLAIVASVWGVPAHAEDHLFITLATTMSAQRSGLLSYLSVVFARRTGIEIYAVPLGTRQALMSGEVGECDVLLVHDRERELQFMRSGFGSVRREVMHDDYILVGPEEDPAKIGGMHDVRAALRKIAEAKALFISRGDGSTTDTAEQQIWTEAIGGEVPGREPWHRITESSMQRTLTAAALSGGYAFADRATWVKLSDHRHLKIVVEGDPRMIDQYSVILVNPAKHPQVKAKLGLAFIDWLTSEEGQSTIASYRVEGKEVFFPALKVKP
jgi:tungstate transport system substrate-binding protein